MNIQALLLGLVLAILSVGYTMGQSKKQMMQSFKAYDCSAPVAIEPIHSPEEEQEPGRRSDLRTLHGEPLQHREPCGGRCL